MARPLRIEYPGAVYHVTSRGNGRNAICLNDSDREKFLAVLGSVVRRYNWLCHAYCLMGNHYHLVIETPDANLSKGMRQLNGVYTQVFNKEHHSVGHIFQGRFKAIIVEKESYLLELCRYVVLNPIRANVVTLPDQWKWSSYCATAGITKAPAFLSIEWILGHFGKQVEPSQTVYRQFVHDGVNNGDPWQKVTGQIFLGQDGFVDTLEEYVGYMKDNKEIPRQQRHASRPALEGFFSVDLKKEEKDRRIYEACSYGYTFKEIADVLGLHYATVGRAVTRIEKKYSIARPDPHLCVTPICDPHLYLYDPHL